MASGAGARHTGPRPSLNGQPGGARVSGVNAAPLLFATALRWILGHNSRHGDAHRGVEFPSHFLTGGQKTIDFASEIDIVYISIFTTIFGNRPIHPHTDRYPCAFPSPYKSHAASARGARTPS